MLSSEREEFEQLVRVLCAGFNVPATPERIEAYWRGCNRMSLITFGRVVDMALEEASEDDRVPTAPKLWSYFRKIRDTASKAPGGPNAPPEPADPLKTFGSRCLLSFVLRKAWPPKKGGVRQEGHATSDAGMRAMTSAKDEILATMRADADFMRAFNMPDGTSEAVEAVRELQQVLIRAFARAWQPRSEEEHAADHEHFARTNRARDAFVGAEL